MMKMDEIEKQIEELLELLENDQRIQRILVLKNKLLGDFVFRKHLIDFQNLDPYSEKYQRSKIELFKNHDFVEFKQLETELNFLILEMNQKLKQLVEERVCQNENH